MSTETDRREVELRKLEEEFSGGFRSEWTFPREYRAGFLSACAYANAATFRELARMTAYDLREFILARL